MENRGEREREKERGAVKKERGDREPGKEITEERGREEKGTKQTKI